VRGVDGSGQPIPLGPGADRVLQRRQDQADPRALRCSSRSSSMSAAVMPSIGGRPLLTTVSAWRSRRPRPRRGPGRPTPTQQMVREWPPRLAGQARPR
jgi:hypothetical protein